VGHLGECGMGAETQCGGERDDGAVDAHKPSREKDEVNLELMSKGREVVPKAGCRLPGGGRVNRNWHRPRVPR
jgi:hypothetical protein